MQLAFATTCKNRLNHLSQTLPKNLRDINGRKDTGIVLLDYNDTEGLGAWIEQHHKADLDSGKLVYYRTTDHPKFRMAHAKNLAHRLAMREGASILVNVDADNYTGEGFADYVVKKFEDAATDQEAIFLGTRGNHRGPGKLAKIKTQRGCFGRIGVSDQAFRHAGGYDEIFETWSPDDKDFAGRIGRLGYSWRQIRYNFLSAIQHGAGMRFREYGYMTFDPEEDVLAGRQDIRIVNAGNIGAGVVYRNFSPEPTGNKAYSKSGVWHWNA